jgi:hypothetical protein
MSDWKNAIMPQEVLDEAVDEQAKANTQFSWGKPGKGVIFMAHPTHYGDFAFWKHELDTDSQETYLVMDPEVVKKHATRVSMYTCYLYVTHDGRWGVWPVNNLKNNKYGRTGHAAAKMAMSEWIQIHSDNTRKRYVINRVPPAKLAELGEAKWPSHLEHIAEAVVAALDDDDLLITSTAHPLVRAIGEEVTIDLSDIK